MKSFLYRQLALFSQTKTKLLLLYGLVVFSSIASLVFAQIPAEGTQTDKRDNTRVEVVTPPSESQSKSQASSQPASPIAGPQTSQQQPAVKYMPIYRSSDFLSGYLSNRTFSIIIEGKPWINASTNVAQYQLENGGTTFWDYWPDNEAWESTNHMWQDDQGKWRLYTTETLKLDGYEKTAYVLVDREGPGVLDKLWFTNETTSSFLRVLNVWELSGDSDELIEWGNLAKLGNLRIEVDNRVVYDGPIKNWFTGNAQHLTPPLAEILVWRFRQFGSVCNIIPIAYSERIKILVYGTAAKPKWFMATGVTLPKGTRINSYTGAANDLPLDAMTRLASQVRTPETYINTFENTHIRDLSVRPGSPSVLEFKGAGTLETLQIKIQKSYDLKNLWLRIAYADQIGIDLPLVAFFGEPDQVSLHHSSPLGIIEQGDSYLFYSNYPMPYQDGMTIEISTAQVAIPVNVRAAISNQTNNTQLAVLYKPSEKLQACGPDYAVDIKGNGKLVGLVLVTKDQEFSKVPTYCSQSQPFEVRDGSNKA